MAQMTVGGRPLDLTRQEVEQKMRGHQPEPIREHLVEMLDTVYPPKQVLATVTGWDRTSFTTMEAQRVLTKIGFVCRRAGGDQADRPAWGRTDATMPPTASLNERMADLEAGLVVAQQAIVGLTSRINVLEGRSR
jgi:hypothetical protein